VATLASHLVLQFWKPQTSAGMGRTPRIATAVLGIYRGGRVGD